MRPSILALGRVKSGQKNDTEEAYGQMLESEKRCGTVAWYAFEGITFKLAEGLRYTPDYIVMLSDGTMEAHEVKGFWRDDAKAKIKMASALFPFRFLAVRKQAKKDGGGWTIEDF